MEMNISYNSFMVGMDLFYVQVQPEGHQLKHWYIILYYNQVLGKAISRCVYQQSTQCLRITFTQLSSQCFC